MTGGKPASQSAARQAAADLQRPRGRQGNAHTLSDDRREKGSTDEKYYTVEEVADILNVSPRTVRRWIRNKVIKSYKFGTARRIASSDLQALIA